MDIDDLKRKLRELKKHEKRIRFDGTQPNALSVWDSFFNTKEPDDPKIKYNMNRLLQMDKEAIRFVIDEFFFCMYYQMSKDKGYELKNVYDPDMLRLLGLPPYASMSDIKKRFRQLAKIHHPDQGGDAEKMVELLDLYKGIINDKK